MSSTVNVQYCRNSVIRGVARNPINILYGGVLNKQVALPLDVSKVLAAALVMTG